jgi:serine/threonine protein kinase
MNRGLPKSLRARWDDLIATEGRALGLDGCGPFIENKLVNDIFYDGMFKGLPSVVKCSSRAPASIVNEYELAKRLYETDPVHFPAAYVCHPGPWAFVATEKIAGGRSLAEDPDEKYADEVLSILDSLYRANVVHRDIQPSNFLIAPDGHLKLIDFQFAVDMNNQRIDPWLMKHPTYHFGVFAAVVKRDKAWWDDAVFARLLLPSLRERLQSRIGRLRLEVPFSFPVRVRLQLFALGMRIQRFFCFFNSRKRCALDRRLKRFS